MNTIQKTTEKKESNKFGKAILKATPIVLLSLAVVMFVGIISYGCKGIADGIKEKNNTHETSTGEFIDSELVR